ncbi:hypothetical protein CHLNCDRAFT_144169 [Chlorella variabilis]|uniref:Uncharacterized protein n=1 Tax=Chlorella variabilis TaxID=554065 RepID=E1ZC25_CHLVA|nr:hypothetical protein CHLNCDRAFT_144169 [Chlorella variabilis]EFN56533.1 hypothetical protein CHLNCDRAFT_144169 [Chlorella variabilis]|eukprot:XP_005848635.1 hypothetical protein CHLNCDRAFT_144169 [Chlorella variabilis]
MQRLNEGGRQQAEAAVAEAVRRKLQAAVETEHTYRHILAFTAFMAAYLTALGLSDQDLPSVCLAGGATSARFGSSGEVLDYIEGRLVAPHWRDPVCGDGACEAPIEFAAFGRFGCKADCGVEPNTTRLLVKVRSNFGGHPLLAPRLLMAAARWNVCLMDAARRQRGDPDLCWFERDQVFTEAAATRLETMDVIDGSWYVAVQGDYAGRVQGAVYSMQDPDNPKQLTLQAGRCQP